MINNKNQLKKALKENKENLIFLTTFNEHKPEHEGIKRKAAKIQSNAFTLATEKDGVIIDSWIYLNDIEVQDNQIKIYAYIPQDYLYKYNVDELIPLNEKESLTINKGNNWNYTYKKVIIKIEILESDL